MNLSFIVDVAIGLIFIYLILSLLVSEIQELIATLLQWRAKHLKDSIETLLDGGSESNEAQNVDDVMQLANQLYNDPLINTLNYEAKGVMASGFRKLTRFMGSLSRNNTDNGINKPKNSAPSYIPSETFATTLIGTLQLPTLLQELNQELGEESLSIFQEERLSQIKSYFTILDAPDINDEDRLILQEDEYNELQKSFREILTAFQSRQANLTTSINRMLEHLDNYITISQDVLPEGKNKNKFIRKLKLLRQDIFTNTTEAIWIGGVRPNLTQILKAYQEVRETKKDANSPVHQKIRELRVGGKEEGEKLVKVLPKSLTESLYILASRARVKIDNAEEELNQFKKEVETWFDRSMDRSSGVYRRNAKGVAILIGLLVAGISNTDTLHIINSLSKNSALRTVITQKLNQVPNQSNDINAIRAQVKEINQTLLEDISIPIGWSADNLAQQKQEEWQVNGYTIPFIKRVAGWMLSGLAIAMGAPFWFDLLGKVVNVRNAGPRPVSYTKDQPPSG